VISNAVNTLLAPSLPTDTLPRTRGQLLKNMVSPSKTAKQTG